MFFETQEEKNRIYYRTLLEAVGSLSRLFSEAPEPYIASRVAENVFCKAFEAKNISRSDTSADASKNMIGFGIKTFLNGNGKTFQKIAEFNSVHSIIGGLSVEEKIHKIAELRNERLSTTKRIYGLKDIIYHCIARQAGKIIIYETPCLPIRIETCKIHNYKNSTIQFKDGLEEYSFNISKSTLYKRFVTSKILLEIPVTIINDPYDAIVKLRGEIPIYAPERVQPHIFLPLYSNKNGNKYVPKKSGINQWNASGRPRDPNEIYIPIPAWIHKTFPNFFPARDTSFKLTLPDGTFISAKVCQDNNKALMSNPNSDLGKWLLRKVMNLPERELLTYDKLESIGLDAVVVYKIDSEKYGIDFAKSGSYEKFFNKYHENKSRIINEEIGDED
ncbi:MAG: NgoFVII family restriction endonuclease [Candidatus Micrarchaeia archaeon]